MEAWQMTEADTLPSPVWRGGNPSVPCVNTVVRAVSGRVGHDVYLRPEESLHGSQSALAVPAG